MNGFRPVSLAYKEEYSHRYVAEELVGNSLFRQLNRDDVPVISYADEILILAKTCTRESFKIQYKVH